MSFSATWRSATATFSQSCPAQARRHQAALGHRAAAQPEQGGGGSQRLCQELLLDMTDLEDLFFDATPLGTASRLSSTTGTGLVATGRWCASTTVRRHGSASTATPAPNCACATALWTARRCAVRLDDARPQGHVRLHRALRPRARAGLALLVQTLLGWRPGRVPRHLRLAVAHRQISVERQPGEKATLWRAVAGIGHNAAGVIPRQWPSSSRKPRKARKSLSR